MIRYGLIVAALVLGASSYALAVERATFILIDGERKSGTVVFHGSSRENLINNYLNLGTDDGGKELTIPIDQVAVIDFVGGRPPSAELDELANDRSSQLLVLRDGYTQLGRLVNLIGGDTLRWRNAGGQEQQYAIRDVKRVYLNPESARIVFNHTGTRQNAGQSGPVSIQVDARQPWTDTGLTVTRGQQVSFRVAGQIQYAPTRRDTTGPEGNASSRRPDFPVPGASVGALIGRIDNGIPFLIGSQTGPIVMPASGRLWVGVNDTNFGDNSGAYSVVVTPSGGSGNVTDAGTIPRQPTAIPRRAR